MRQNVLSSSIYKIPPCSVSTLELIVWCGPCLCRCGGHIGTQCEDLCSPPLHRQNVLCHIWGAWSSGWSKYMVWAVSGTALNVACRVHVIMLFEIWCPVYMVYYLLFLNTEQHLWWIPHRRKRWPQWNISRAEHRAAVSCSQVFSQCTGAQAQAN